MKRVCPLCGVRGSLADEHIGRKVRCPKCHGIFVAELPAAGPSPVVLPGEGLASVSAAPATMAALSEKEEAAALDAGQAALAAAPFGLEEEGKSGETVVAAEELHGGPAQPVDEVPVVAEPVVLAEALSEPAAVMTVSSAETVTPAEVDAEAVTESGDTAARADLQDQSPASGDVELDSGTPAPLQRNPADPPVPPLEPVKHAAAAFSAAPADHGGEREPYGRGEPQGAASPPSGASAPFTVGDMLGEAWRRCEGVKGAIWAGSAIMYLALFALAATGTSLLFPAGPIEAGFSLADLIWQTLVQVVVMIFIAGLLRMGINQAVGDAVSWRMIFSGFPLAGKIAVASVLQMILISIGFLLLVLPGIYLSVGYAMTLPLIIDKGLSPWQAMEASRKAVHRVWWRVAGLFVVTGLIMAISAIPLGIGLIWTWPMFIVLAGVIYHRLFGN